MRSQLLAAAAIAGGCVWLLLCLAGFSESRAPVIAVTARFKGRPTTIERNLTASTGALYELEGYFNPLLYNVPTALLGKGTVPLVLSVSPQDDKPFALVRPAFNPSIVRIPTAMAAVLPAGAVYLLVTRRYSSQCSNLWGRDARDKSRRVVESADRKATPHASIFRLLDRFFQLMPVELVFSPADFALWAYDVRLHVHKDMLLATYQSHNMLVVSQLMFDTALDQSKTSAAFRVHNLVPGNLTSREYRAGYQGKNYGVLWHKESLYLQSWLAENYTLPAAVATQQQPVGVLSNGPKLHPRGPMNASTLHNNALNEIVLTLGSTQQQFRLLMGHTRLPSAPELFTSHGGVYFQHFLLADVDLPFSLHAQSPPFCMPAGHFPHLCEKIQFVMSALYFPAQQEVLLTYGVNDCESAAIRVRVDDIFAFTLQQRPLVFSSTWPL